MNEMRQYIDATNQLNESLNEGPIGWATDKIIKGAQKAAAKVTYGGTKSRLQQLAANREAAAILLKTWNTKYALHGKKRLPIDTMNFLKTELKMTDVDIKNAWDQTPEITTKYGKYVQVINQYKKADPSEKADPGERRDQSQLEPKQPIRRTGLTADPATRPAGPRESIEEAPIAGMTVTQKMSTDDFRDLLINAIDVKNKAAAEKELGDLPGEEPKSAKEPRAAKEPKPKPAEEPAEKPKAGAPDEQPMDKETVDKLKQAGARDMDNDGDYDWDDIAKTAVAQGKGEETLSAIMKAISPEKAALVKAVLKGKIR